MSSENIENYAWSIRDEGQLEAICAKYADRKKLYSEYEERKKVADSNHTTNGKPHPNYPRLRIEAEIALMHYEMAYLVQKNKDLQQQMNILGGLYERVSILEGAYNFLMMGYEHAKKSFNEALAKHVSSAVRK